MQARMATPLRGGIANPPLLKFEAYRPLADNNSSIIDILSPVLTKPGFFTRRQLKNLPFY
jgi:hypothetical protein